MVDPPCTIDWLTNIGGCTLMGGRTGGGCGRTGGPIIIIGGRIT